MIRKKFVTGIIVLAITALVGFGTNAYAADETPAPTKGQMGYHGKGAQGKCPMMGKMGGQGSFRPNLTSEEMEKFEAERNAYRDATKDLRRDIYQKHLELKAEMAKKNPDKKKAMATQKEISKLNAEMAEKRLEHRFQLKAINSDLGSGMGKFHHGGMMGKGQYSKRPCQM